ncbi:PAS domain-containing protein [Methanoculleus taiwanensis]|uniref:PAS domain-containing protein n=1 Tax=Methanoculleus taiwanensis TaxID=1550565 RepID=UPI0013E8BF22|nr:PAS domain-containing protein [Methanoculleus taiwanensis]
MRPPERETGEARRHLQAGGDDERMGALETMQAGVGVMQARCEEIAAALAVTEVRCRHYRALFDAAPEACIVIDLECVIREANRRAAALFGADSDVLIATSLFRFIAEEDHEGLAAWLRLSEEERSESGWETCLLACNREPIPVALSVSHVHDERGAHAGYLLGFQDIARQKGGEITALKHTEKVLGLSNRKLHLLTSVTRHDILNRLNVLLGYLELAQGQTSDPILQEYVRRAKDAAFGIRSYIAFTRAYQEVGVRSPQWQTVRRVIRKALASQTGGSIRVDIDIPPIEMYADPMIEKAFANLLDNSLRHGGSVTRIRFSCSESKAGLAVVYEDDGIGVAYRDKNRIFDRGYGKQTGLGLFLVREILAITDLTIRETGIPGEGARFEIRIPQGLYRPVGVCGS